MSNYDLVQVLVAIAYAVLGFALGVLSVGIFITWRLLQIGCYSLDEVEDLFHTFIVSDVVAQVCHRRKKGSTAALNDWGHLYWFLKMAAHFLPVARRRRVQNHLESVLNQYSLPMSFLDEGDYRRANEPWPMAQPKGSVTWTRPRSIKHGWGRDWWSELNYRLSDYYQLRMWLQWCGVTTVILAVLTMVLHTNSWGWVALISTTASVIVDLYLTLRLRLAVKLERKLLQGAIDRNERR